MIFEKYQSWHIEPTNRCTLACPKCPRTTEKINSFYDINVSHLKNFFTGSLLSKCSYVSLAGNYGDPIYHPQLSDIIDIFKNTNVCVNITTNGSHRPIHWWKNILTHLQEKDQITFSVDGLEDTNHIYRVNSKWKSIHDAMKLCLQSDVWVRWKFIVFKHNQHQIAEAEELAKKIGVKKFQLVYSNRYDGPDDPLIPDDKYVTSKDQKELLPYVNPFCINGDSHYINAKGNYYPCCWLEFSNPFELNISNNTFDDINNHILITNLANSWQDSSKCNKICRNTCAYATINDQKIEVKKF